MPTLAGKYVHGRASAPITGMDARSHRGISGDYEKLGMLYPVSPPQGRTPVDDHPAQARPEESRPVDLHGHCCGHDWQADENGTAYFFRRRTAGGAGHACLSTGKNSGCPRTVDGERQGGSLKAKAHQTQASVLLTPACVSIRQVLTPFVTLFRRVERRRI